MQKFETTTIGDKEFRWGERTYVMGVINMTPDSFSGDGLEQDIEAAVERALMMQEDGADIIDVGGESTRPAGITYGRGAQPVSAEEELRRVLPVIRRLKDTITIPVSIDTYKAEVAQKAVAEGAALINDVWGLTRDPELAQVAAGARVPVVVTHNQEGYEYHDLISDVLGALRHSVEIARAAGVPEDRIIVDPGIGFGKKLEHNLEMLRHLEDFKTALNYPLLLGTSRKSFIGAVLGGLPPHDRIEGTAATIAVAITKGVDMVRVHDVKQMVRICRMSDAIVRKIRYVDHKRNYENKPR